MGRRLEDIEARIAEAEKHREAEDAKEIRGRQLENEHDLG